MSKPIEEIQLDIRREKGRLRSTAAVMDWEKHSKASNRVIELGQELAQANKEASNET